MSSAHALRSNFAHLKEHDEQFVRIGMLAERYFAEDPNTCLLKLRQLAEVLAQAAATHMGIFQKPEEGQYELLGRLRDSRILPPEIHQLFHEIRRTGNAANHALAGDHRTALAILKITWQAGVWFHRTFRNPDYRSGPFIPPQAPRDESAELKLELEELSKALEERKTETQEQAQQLEALSGQLRAAQDEQSFWERMAAEVEAEKSELNQRLAAWQQQAQAQPAAAVTALIDRSNQAADRIKLDEKATRQLIDSQLRQAGWTVDSQELRYSHGTRPRKGENLAIAEWPTATGPADYVLFAGLTPLAAVEAKRRNVDVSARLQQSKRYSRGFQPSAETVMPETNWGSDREFRLPFVYSSNGRPFLRQLATHSGIWFADLRRPDNLSRPLQGWHTPEGLSALLAQDAPASEEKLREEPFTYGFPIRDYQIAAISAVEKGIAEGRQALLLAMATGTGKTKTCIALIYRLLKTKRFRRILFLVDRSALGEQAADAFKETRMESVQTFADTFNLKELDGITPDPETSVHIATIQGMVARVLNPGENSSPPPVDQYDCLIVDECHRGYLLDRELSETEQAFRGFDDYVSKYRRVLDYFDAVKIGLTATPALHTSEIFGAPIHTYSYREAVIDGYLVDHEPPWRITTELSRHGIVWQKGAEVSLYKPHDSQLELFKAPDEIRIEVEDFNRRVITRAFNRVVCEQLARELDPASARKTLIFCVNDAHADLVVDELKQAFQEIYGTVEDDAVIKITGAADKPLQLIRRFKNERNPNVAVTVDLLTTGVDVPKICNLVFLRRVNSRILFDQMLGRATRQCPEIGKEVFRIFDAVRIYEAVQAITAMRPVAADPSIRFTQLVREFSEVGTEEARLLIRDQFLAKLQRKQRHLGEQTARDFETKTGMPPEEFIRKLRQMPLPEIAACFQALPDLGEILDRKSGSESPPLYVSHHPDSLVMMEQGYGGTGKPEDYLKEFAAFINSGDNRLPALLTVITRPRDLTRRELRDLLYELDKAGFSETRLQAAWKATTNQDIAARIIGYIRQAALGDPLIPFQTRVDHALQAMLSSRAWTTPQKDWLRKLAAQTTANLLVDRAAIDDPALIFKRDGGGFTRLDKLFGGKFQEIVAQFNDSVWQRTA